MSLTVPILEDINSTESGFSLYHRIEYSCSDLADAGFCEEQRDVIGAVRHCMTEGDRSLAIGLENIRFVRAAH